MEIRRFYNDLFDLVALVKNAKILNKQTKLRVVAVLTLSEAKSYVQAKRGSCLDNSQGLPCIFLQIHFKGEESFAILKLNREKRNRKHDFSVL